MTCIIFDAPSNCDQYFCVVNVWGFAHNDYLEYFCS